MMRSRRAVLKLYLGETALKRCRIRTAKQFASTIKRRLKTGYKNIYHVIISNYIITHLSDYKNSIENLLESRNRVYSDRMSLIFNIGL